MIRRLIIASRVQPSLSSAEQFSEIPEIVFKKSIHDLPYNFEPEVIVLAVKPKQFKTGLSGCEAYLKKEVVVSLLTGVSLQPLRDHLGEHQPVIRLMPNLTIQIGESVNLIYSSPD
ncbi:pyrroline-5-carboxylate reductase family protein [Pajaroellobacter abortibovis]|uniref:Pyrroline-5-carboxylate reductase catalytic N-terminal domain-containing protein n=1 Tax=Pajaroellobacter abortibovis TaxID=1882918 RepID=A0A1L6MX23_9BACT|nr:hypothetical protein [Pajaroellobacter abortibovis]APS00100.1 hypothetical protein BCY86_04955 [Pajaroellobacter abortibovis]